MKWILHYWKATSIVGLVFDKSMAKHRDIVGYVDFEYASDPNKWSFLWLYFLFVILLLVGKWVLDYCCFINHWSWIYFSYRRQHQRIHLAQRLVNHHGLLQNITTIFCDRRSVIHLTKNKMYRERTKYIDVEHFIWEIVARGEIIFRKIATDNIFPVDMLTKPTLLSKLKHCLDLIGVDYS